MKSNFSREERKTRKREARALYLLKTRADHRIMKLERRAAHD